MSARLSNTWIWKRDKYQLLYIYKVSRKPIFWKNLVRNKDYNKSRLDCIDINAEYRMQEDKKYPTKSIVKK